MTENISWSQNGEVTNFAKSSFTDILRFDSRTLLGVFMPIQFSREAIYDNINTFTRGK